MSMQRLSAVLLGASLLLPQNALAMGNIQFGKLSVKPTVGLEERYDSNIYLVPENLNGVPAQGAGGSGVVDAMITDLKAGVGFKFPINDMHKLSAGYNANWLGYNKHQGANNALNQNAKLAYDYMGPMGLKGNLYNDYENTTDSAFSELTDREQRWQNKFGGALEYRPEGGKLFAEVHGGDKRDKYLNEAAGGTGQLLDRITYGFGLKAGYYVMPKTRVFLGYDRQFIHYTNAVGRSKDNNSHQYGAGLEGQVLPTVKASVDTGVTTRHYDATNQATTQQTTNSINWYVQSNLKWNPTEKCDFSLNYRRAIEESTFSNNRFYIANKVNLNASHQFPYKLKFKLGVGWGVDKYPEASTTGGFTASRRDDTYSLTTGLNYDIQDWLTAYLNYQYDQRFSVFTGQYNYKRHMPSLGVSARF